MDNLRIPLNMRAMDTDADILIVGGGLNGPLLATALARGGFRVEVLDAAPAETFDDPEFDGRAYALALSSRRMLEALGIWEAVAEHAQPINDIEVSGGNAGEGAGPFFLHFDHNEIAEGPMGHFLEDRFLRPALRAAAGAADGVTLRYGAEVVAQEVSPGAVSVTLDGGETRIARLLVGADGRASPTAKRAGIARTGWGYGQTSLVASIAHENPHHGVAYQLFMPEGPIGILPLPGNVCSIVWTETGARAEAIMALPEEDFLEVLRPRFGDFLGEISLVGKRYSYPLGLSLAYRLVLPRLALVGDAAHGVHPLAGQGLNLGFRDAAALAEVLTLARRRGEDIGAINVLERYRRWRQFDIATLAAATDGINRLFSNDNPLLRVGRDLALGAINSAPGLRRRLIREAAGIAGDLPLLLRGRPI